MCHVVSLIHVRMTVCARLGVTPVEDVTRRGREVRKFKNHCLKQKEAYKNDIVEIEGVPYSVHLKLAAVLLTPEEYQEARNLERREIITAIDPQVIQQMTIYMTGSTVDILPCH